MLENTLTQVPGTHLYTVPASLACTTVWAEQRRAAVTLKYPRKEPMRYLDVPGS